MVDRTPSCYRSFLGQTTDDISDVDEAEAAKWMRKAAGQGLAAGQFGLGSMYAHGEGVPQSETKAVAWYRKAADQGDAPATNNLTYLLATSNDPKIHNPKEAVSVAEKAVGNFVMKSDETR